ncbi:MAG: hypothetical protein ABI905_13155 [Betaproteobacteria bacterium]
MKTEITPAFLARAHEELVLALTNRGMAMQARWEAKIRVPALLVLAQTILALVLIVLAYIAIDLWPNHIPMSLVGLGLFLLTLLFALGRLVKARRRISIAVLRWAARTSADSLIKNARKQAPFTATYSCIGNAITYRRLKDDQLQEVWARNLGGVVLHGSTFSVFFRNDISQFVKMIVLHEPGAEWDAYLAGLGIHLVLFR